MVLLSGVRTGRWGDPLEGGSALRARREGVTTVILVGASVGVRGVDMAGDGRSRASSPTGLGCRDC